MDAQKNLTIEEQNIANHYEHDVLDYQTRRLEQESPIEYAITRRVFDQYIPDGSTILYVGVGVGHYATHLALRGCRFHFVDLCQPFLDAANARMANHRFSQQVLSSTFASATSMDFIQDQSVDCVMMMGPFYHLTSPMLRYKAIMESCRVLKNKGMIFAAGINRLAILRELFCCDRYFANRDISIQHIVQDLSSYLHDGVSNNKIFSPLGDAYCATAAEFTNMFADHFIQVDMLGVESFAGHQQKEFFKKLQSEREIWIDLIEQTACMPEGIAAAEHFLYVGRKHD